jgi:hypothetical protein
MLADKRRKVLGVIMNFNVKETARVHLRREFPYCNSKDNDNGNNSHSNGTAHA